MKLHRDTVRHLLIISAGTELDLKCGIFIITRETFPYKVCTFFGRHMTKWKSDWPECDWPEFGIMRTKESTKDTSPPLLRPFC